MSVEREILIAILRLTKNPIDHSLVSKTARVPTQIAKKIFEKLRASDLIELKGKVLQASSDQRIKMAVQALKYGADFERVCSLLEWREFESIATRAFEVNSYNVIRNLRFKGDNARRWEIDLLACKQPTILSVDCKQWKHNWTKAPIAAMTEQHMDRTRAFTDILPRISTRIRLDRWKYATVIPVILSLLQGPFKFHREIPIVPVLQLQSFLNELPAHIGSLTSFSQKIKRIDGKITEY